MNKGKNKKRWILIACLAVLAAGAYYFYASFHGSLIARAVTTAKAKAYVSEHYPELPFRVDLGRYDFKCGGYFCPVWVENSPDSAFTVSNFAGALSDDYESRVLQKENTVRRLMDELDAYVEKLMARVYPHRASLVLCDLAGEITQNEREKLTADMPFSASDFPLDAELVIWTESEEDAPSWDEAAKRLRELEKLMRENVPAVTVYSLCLQKPYGDADPNDAPPMNDGSEICAYGVPADVIAGEGLEAYLDRMRIAQEEERKAIANGETVK